MTWNLARSIPAGCRSRAPRTDWLLATPFGLIVLLAFAFFVAPQSVRGAEASLLSYGDFEPDQATTTREIPGTAYTVGTDQTDVWYGRFGTGSQQVSYADDGAGNHFITVGYSGTQSGIFQVIAWPGEGAVELAYSYRGPTAKARVYGAITGDTLNKFNATNTLTLLQQIDNPASDSWTNVTQEVTLTGSFDYLVVQFGSAFTDANSFDNISLAPPEDTAPTITTEALPGTQIGAAYSVTLEATGGNGALVWSLAGGTLPSGLSLSPDGMISGVSTTAGTSTFTVRVEDSDANVDPSDEETRELSIVVSVPVPPAASIVTTRTSGVAPLAVSFDATATTSLTTERPFHDLHYHWNYGDPGSGVWATSRKSKNEDLGALGGHVYETPGVYTATLTVTDATGASAQATVEISVEDPDVVFAGENTICISTDGDFTGAPAGSLHVTSASWATIASSLGTGKRVLLKRGNTWVSDGTRITMNFAGPGILGAFGTGPKPIITFAADGTGWTFFMGNGNTPYQFGDFRFMDFEIQGRGFNYSGFHAEGAFNNLTILRVDASEMGVFLNLSPPILRYYNNDDRPGHQLWEGVAVVDTRFEKVVGDGGEFNGRHIAYAGMARSLFMGNIWNNAEQGEHILRVPFARRLIIAHNELTNARLTKHLIKMHGGGTEDVPGQWVPPGENQTRYVTIADNYFSSRLGDWFVSVGPQNNSSAEVALDVIVERNQAVFGGDSNIAFHMAASSTTVRNNTVIMTGATGSGTIATIDRRGIEPAPADNQVYNNSGYSGNTQSFTLASVVASATNTVVRNNLGRSLGTSKTLINGGGTNLVESNNVITDTPGWVVADPTTSHHFDLVSGSEAIGAGYPVALLSDFEGEPRQPSAGISLGAFESPPNTADVAPAIVTTELRDGAYGETYWVTLEGEGGNGRLHWALVSGSLPEGLELRANGQIVGKPTVSGSFTFAVSLEDSDGAIGGSDAAERAFTLEIAAEPNSVPRITASDVPAAVVGESYSRALTAIDGNGALTWTLTSGALPAGLSLSAEGVISGTATVTGNYEFTVSVADGDDVVGAEDEDTATYTLVVNPAGSVTGYQGSTFYNQSFAAQAGQFEATFDVYVPTKPINAPIGLSFGPATSYAQMAAIIGFSAEGYLNARDGGAYTYTAPAIDYEAGMTLGYRLVVDIPAKKYSVYVSVDGGEEQLLADNFDFRTEQASVAALNNLSVKVDAPVGGWISVTNFAVTPIGEPGVPVTGVSVAPASVELEIGETATLTATVAPANASNPVVSWSSSAPMVASVDQNGVVTAISAGSATITATTLEGGFTASSTVTVAGTPGEVSAVIFADAGVHDFGGVPGVLDTEIFRSGTASWRITYDADSATSAFNPQGATLKMSDLTPYANSGYFELWYRSSKAGTAQIRVLDGGAGNANLFEANIPMVATTEWTRVEIPFTGWTQAPSTTANWKLMLRGWIGMTGATVHYDDIRFVGTTPSAVPVTGVSVTPETLALEVGDSATLTATVAPLNATNTAVSWTTSDAAIATVSNSGVVTAVAEGSATITATTEDGGFTATSAVTVTTAVEPGIEVSIYSDAATADMGVPSIGATDTSIFHSGTASWRITYADEWSVSIFHPQGAESTMADLTPYANSGYFELWYRSSQAGTVQLRVLDAGAANANLFQADIPLVATEVWTRVEIPFTGWTQPPSSSANWRLMLRGWGGIGGGTVHYDDIKFIGEEPVSAPVTGVSVAPTSLELMVGESSTLTATVAPANAANTAVSWSTSNAGVATVSGSGVVTAVGVGSATITATTEDGGFKATSTVTVAPAQANDLELVIFSDVGTHAYGGVTGALDSEVRRSGTASWRITYADDWSTSAFNPLGATMSPADLTPYANSGYFEFWYRSSKAGTIRFQVLDVGNVNAALLTVDRPVVATTEWTRIEIPFTGWDLAPSNNTNWRLMLRGYGAMTGATVHYDDIRFVVPSAAGEVPALGVSVSPAATSLEVGQTQQLTATVAPPNATNQDVTWTSSDPSVASVSESGLVMAVAVGAATITVTTDDGGHTAESTITVVEAQPGRHPFLFFSAKDIPTIRARMDAPEVADRRSRLINRANALLSQAPNTDSRWMQGNSGILAFAYIATGNEAYAQRAIQEALATAALPVWINGDDFNRGADLVSSERSLGTALVYDWCYDVMTPEQRTTLRNALLEKGIAQYLMTVDPTLPPNWYTFEPVNNWRGVCHGGNAVAALVLYHESEDARRAAELANQHLPPTIRSLVLEDSGGHEGITYNNYGVDYALKGAMAMQRFYGGYEAVLEEMAVEKLGSYWSVYMFGPDHHFANISRHNYDWAAGYYPDGDVEGGPTSQRSTLVDSLVPGGDQLMRWAADNGSQRFYWSAASPFYFLWRRIGAPTTFQQPMPELQDAVLFRGAGHGIFQSDTLWMAYSGGATHNRGDGGAFVLVAKNGEDWERLIHLEPSLNHFESENQSTYLINGVGQRRGLDTLINRAQYERFGSGAGFHYAASNIKPLYANPALTKLTRHVVMVRGKYVVMLDDLAGSESLNFEARFQTTQANTITVNADGGKVGGQNLDLHIISSGFDPFTTGQGQGSSTAVRHLRFSRQAEEAALLTVLYPTAKGGGAPTVQVNNGVVTITLGDETDEVAFIREGQDWRLSAVNGATADNIPTGAERNIVPYREGRDDAEVPVWMMEVVGDPVIVPDTGVTVSHAQVSLNVGQTQAITATVAPANATNGSVVWTTSNPAIASVTQTSLSAATVRAVGAGTATVTATSSGGFTAQTVVNVTSNAELIVPYASAAPALDGVIDSSYSGVLGVIAKPAPDAPVPPPANISASWRAAFTQTDLHIVVDVIDDVWGVGAVDVWHNDSVELFLDGNNSKTAGSDNIDDVKFTFMPQTDGTVFLLLNGYPPNPPGKDYSGVQAAMTVKSDGASDYLGYVLEIKVPLAVLNITPQEGWKLGVDFQINDSDTPGTRDQYVTWFGSNLNNNPVAYGTVSLGQMSGGGTPKAVTGVTLAPEELTLAVGETGQLAATIEPADADDTTVSWTSSDEAIATVDASGVVTAVAPGTATITVTTTDGGFTASSTITVVAEGNSVPSITTTTLPAGTVGAAYSQTLSATGGDGALVWSLASGTLPDGLDLSADGVISGTPSAAGTSTFTVRVVDSDDVTGASDEDTQELSITIHSESGSEDLAITEQPTSTTVVVGSPITFSVTAPGATTYQWRKNNVNIDGANSDTLSIASATFDDTATYDVVVSDGSESLTSVAVTAVVRALPFDAQGWTVLTPSADSLVVYVSSSEGNDSNDGLTPATPKATITAGNALLRDGYPDHLLLKRGDTFVSNTASTLGAWKSGRSATEPIVISYYGDSGARPIIKIANKFIDHDGAVRNYQAFIGIDIYKSNSDPASPDFANVGSQDAMRFVGGGANILVEDCRLRFAGIVVQTLGGTPYTNFRIARTIITDTWVHNSYTQGDAARVSGLFISGTFGYVLEENVFDHNGWNEVVANAGANQFNHNVYIQYSNGAGAVIRGNISTRASAHGMQVRSGGVVEGNLFSHNAIGFNFGGVQTPTEPAVQTYPNRGLYNVVLNGRLMDTVDNSQPNRTQAVYGITADYMPDILVQENIIANRIASGSNAAFIGTDKMVRVDNIVRQWDPNYDSSDPTWPHPDADIGDYFSTLGGTDSVTDYIHWLRERPLRQLRWDQTAYAAINYIREGFNRGPIDGYYDYDGLSTEDVAPVIVTESISGGVPDVPYEFAFQAIGGNGSLVWTQVAGALPPGLSLNPVGLITGTPTAEGSYSFTVEVRDSDANTSPGDADVAEFILEVAYPPNSVPEITSTWVRSSLVNVDYTHTLQATGGEGDLVWSLVSGSLPPGIDLSSTGVLSGTPTMVGSYTFTVRVADSDELTGPEDEAEQVLVFNVYPSEAIIAPATGAFIHRPFAEQTGVFTATFDVKPSSAPSSGNIALSSGTPTAFSGMAVIIGFDSAGHFVVRNGGAYTYSTLILYQAGVTYHFRFEVNIPDHRYSVYVTPEGGTEQTLALDYAFRTEQNAVTELNTLTATAASPAGSWFELTNFMIGVPGTAPEITTTSLPEGTVGVPYSQTLTATGGDGELVWSIASGSLPVGLDLSGDGVISGTPLAAGSGSVVVRVADSDAHVGEDDEDTQTLDWTIAPAAPVGVTITLGNLQQRYDGLPKPVSVTTDPSNVTVTVTYNGSEEPPVYPGTYDVVATVTENGYVGSATAELEIGITVLVRHGVTMSGEIDGSMQVLLPESTTLNGGAWISGDLLVSGRPGVTVNGNAAYVAVIDADGSATPTQHRVTLNSNTVVRYLVRQVDAIDLPTVAAPPAPSGTRNVAINQAGQSIGDPATLRNLTINSKGGEVAVPPGTYGEFVANGQTAFVLGVAGSETPVVYNLQKLTLNSNSQIKIVGPVVLNVRETVMFNSADAVTHDPAWLTLRIHNGGLTLNGNSNLNGEVVTPTGTVTLNGSSVIEGSVTADRLTINKQAALREPEL